MKRNLVHACIPYLEKNQHTFLQRYLNNLLELKRKKSVIHHSDGFVCSNVKNIIYLFPPGFPCDDNHYNDRGNIFTVNCTLEEQPGQ